ncbi:MAG: hypothetical protein ACPGO5_05240 [Patescibacteria group bacterium]
MHQSYWQYKTFNNTAEETENTVSFQVYDLTDIDLGRFVLGVHSSTDPGTVLTLKNILREAVERFAAIAKPLTVSEALEKTFAYINKHTRADIDQKQLRNMGALLMYINHDEMHYTMHGDFKIMLIRKKHIFDIVKMTYGVPPHNYEKIFSRMYTGSISEQDGLVICTYETWDCFDTKRLPDVLHKLPIEGTAGFLQNFLPNHSPYKLGGIVISFRTTKQNSDLTHSIPQASSVTSLEDLIHTENETSQMISPTPMQRLRKTAGFMVLVFDRVVVVTKKTYSKLPIKNITAKRKFQPIQHQPVLTQKERHRKKVQGREKIVKPKRHRKNPFVSVIQTIRSLPNTLKYFFSRSARLYSKWPKSTKYLLLAAIVVIIIFTQSISITQKRNQAEEQNTFFSQQTDDIEKLQTQASQAIIFKDYARARSLLIQASNAIASLPTPDEQSTQIKADLEATNASFLSKANRQLTINDLEPLATLPIAPEYNNILLKDNTIYTVSQNTVYAIDPGGSITQTNLSNSLGDIYGITLEHPIENDSGVIGLHNTDKISQIDLQTGLVTQMNATIDVSNTTDAFMYTNRLYILDSTTNQIWRHRRGSAAFQAGQPWLQVPNDLSKSKSLAVDGVIYVLDSVQGIIEFNQGTRTSLQSEAIDPPISNATKIFTTENLSNLYILDPTHDRIVIYDKNGDFIQQVTSNSFTNLDALTVTEQGDEATLILLQGADIYRVTISL